MYCAIESLGVTEKTSGACTFTYTIRGFPDGYAPTSAQNPQVTFGGNSVTFAGGAGENWTDTNTWSSVSNYNNYPWLNFYLNVGTFGGGAQTLIGTLRFTGH
jgi:hypothetical protein